ncbi:hypothetical protein DFH09DRAFT_1143676 [Mycena vulgaris]|nr:hypothetical protein DFH09DRAFT_1143676 [Mycena vulgaris]
MLFILYSNEKTACYWISCNHHFPSSRFYGGFRWLDPSESLCIRDSISDDKAGTIGCAVTDILIAATLSFTFYKLEASHTPARSTHSLVRRLMVLSLTSGVIVASVTLLGMIFLVQGVPVYIVVFFSQGRAYALTVLSNFLLGTPISSTPSKTNPNGSRRDAGVVLHLDDHISSDDVSDNNTPRPESMSMQRLPALQAKSHAD